MRLVWACSLAVAACEPPAASTPDQRHDALTPTPAADAASPDAASPDTRVVGALWAHCGVEPFEPRPGPVDVHADLVALLNSLPRPVTLPCYLAALPRPLGLSITDSPFSLQPAVGRLNPRLFVRSGRLIMSVTLAGEQSTHVETAEPDVVGFSVKGDLDFPRSGPVSERDFFDGIATDRGSMCRLCHRGEHEVRRVEGTPAFSSGALKPAARNLMPLSMARAYTNACDPADLGLRCQVLRALFRLPEALEPMEWHEGTTTF